MPETFADALRQAQDSTFYPPQKCPYPIRSQLIVKNNADYISIGAKWKYRGYMYGKAFVFAKRKQECVDCDALKPITHFEEKIFDNVTTCKICKLRAER